MDRISLTCEVCGEEFLLLQYFSKLIKPGHSPVKFIQKHLRCRDDIDETLNGRVGLKLSCDSEKDLIHLDVKHA